ncbi:MAG: hypothetical protein QG574_2727 [Cyanobacteriota bacterium erpe_2018_sw_21hr_WHONDRS-SW48-000092_B_bin.40]|jgi:hypothetical protein|nr:hypothetical protein [Cyanobacteriota bacterium erpe_2018_sw_21hr_WHONDRS-SW48-000092_B_bin.40]
MLTFTVSDLQTITAEAITSAQRQLAERNEQIFRNAMQQLKTDVASGRQFSVAMSLKNGTDYEGKGKILRPEQLTGIAALVYAKCQVFEPTLEYWSRYEGDQRDGYTVEGFNIVLHWSNVDDLLAKLSTLNDDTTISAIRQSIEAAQSAITDKAASILTQLKERATAQARSGKSWAIVMSLKAGVDFEKPSHVPLPQITAAWLGPVAKVVWEACAKFNPTFEYWSRQEGDQRDSYTVEGINIVVHW